MMKSQDLSMQTKDHYDPLKIIKTPQFLQLHENI